LNTGNKKAGLLVNIVLLISIVSYVLSAANLVRASDAPTTLSVSPSKLTVAQGEQFDVAVKLATTIDTCSAGFQMSWNNADKSGSLTCTGIELGNFFDAGLIIQLGGSYSDNCTAEQVGAYLAAGEGVFQPPNEDGEALVIFHFEAMVEGTYTLHVYDYQVADSEYLVVPTDVFEGQVEVTAPKPPPSPSALEATDMNYHEIELDWTDNAMNEEKMSIWRAADSLFSIDNTLISELPADTTSYTDTKDIEPDTTYFYRIYASNEIGSSGPSNVLEVTTWPRIPPSPTELIVEEWYVEEDEVELQWIDNAPNEIGYRIERAWDEDFKEGVRRFYVDEDEDSYEDTTARQNETYYYRVYAYGDFGDSEPSNVVYVAIAPGVPAAPSDLEVVSATFSAVNLKWKDNADNEEGFHIERARAKDFKTGKRRYSINEESVRKYTDDELLDGFTYYYRIYAHNKYGQSLVSDIVGVVIPAMPTELEAKVVNDTQVNLTWQDNDNSETGFRIERARTIEFTDEKTSFYVGPDITAYSDVDTEQNTTYYYRVFTYYADDDVEDEIYEDTESPPSDTVAAHVQEPLKVVENKKAQVDLTDMVDQYGTTTTSLSFTSLKGVKSLDIGDENVLLTYDNEPLKEIRTTLVESDMLCLMKYDVIGLPATLFKPKDSAVIPPVSLTHQYKAQVIGTVVDLQPSGAHFSQPVTITLEYDKGAYPPEKAQKDLILAYYDAHADRWIELDSRVNPVGHTITAEIAHFSTIGILKRGERTVEWWRMSTIIAIEMVMGLSIYIIIWLRKRRTN
jgi:hypothetical protein